MFDLQYLRAPGGEDPPSRNQFQESALWEAAWNVQIATPELDPHLGLVLSWPAPLAANTASASVATDTMDATATAEIWHTWGLGLNTTVCYNTLPDVPASPQQTTLEPDPDLPRRRRAPEELRPGHDSPFVRTSGQGRWVPLRGRSLHRPPTRRRGG